MRVPSFEVRSQRSIRLAKCEQVPPLMIIAGPNGTGKSTLLNTIRTSNGYQNIMYVGPHRAMRRQQVQQRHLLASTISFESLLSSASTPGFEGIRLFDGSRDPWSYDDSANYLKHALCQIEMDRQHAIATLFDQQGEIARGSLVDPWQPLKELAHNLLPHLSFERIDASNRNEVRCLWNVHGAGSSVDLDDLSSGEKSIIQMFYPLVEREIKALLAQIQNAPQIEEHPDLCILIDEPELHLHPNLQLKVLDYLRVLTSGKRTQVIIATHSPTMVEYASFEELFLLRPIELVAPEDNQLVRVANDEERLHALREVFGSTSNLTSMQPLVVVEGVNERDASRVMPDRKLYRALHPGFDGVTLIAGGGKSECKALLTVLNNAITQFSPQLRAIALLDRDTDTVPSDDLIHLLPVAMIENFLIDPDSIWEAIQSVIEKTGMQTVDDVTNALTEILDAAEHDEIGRRTSRILGNAHFYPALPADQIEVQASTFVEVIQNRYSVTAINEAVSTAQIQVQALRQNHRRREEFHGKSVLQEFYKQHLAHSGLAKVIFAFETARHARRRKSVVQYFDEFFQKTTVKK